MGSDDLNDQLGSLFSEDDLKKIEEEAQKLRDQSNSNPSNDKGFDYLLKDALGDKNNANNLSDLMSHLQKNMTDEQKNISNNMMKDLFDMISGKPINKEKLSDPLNSKNILKIAQNFIEVSSNKLVDQSIINSYYSFATNASLWLDGVISFDAIRLDDHQNFSIIRPTQWIDDTYEVWCRLALPNAKSSQNAFREQIKKQMGEISDEMPGALLGLNINGKETTLDLDSGAPIEDIVLSLSKNSFESQAGKSLGELSSIILYGSQYNIPISECKITLLPFNIQKFAKNNNIDFNQLSQMLMTKEIASVRLFKNTPWLKGYVLSIIESYSHSIKNNLESLASKIESIDVENMDDISNLVNSSDIDPLVTDEQKKLLKKLEVVLALIESWVEFVSFRASVAHIQDYSKISEALVRYKITNSTTESIFKNLIGIRLKSSQISSLSNKALKIWEKLYSDADDISEIDSIWGSQNSIDELILNNYNSFGIESNDIKIEHDWDSLLS